MLKLHDDARGAYELDHAAGEYALTHFADPDRTPSAVILMSVEVAVAQAQAILRRSAPDLLAPAPAPIKAGSIHDVFEKFAGGPPASGPMNDRRGNLVIFPRRV